MTDKLRPFLCGSGAIPRARENLFARVVVLADTGAATDVRQDAVSKVPLPALQAPAERQHAPFSPRTGENIRLLKGAADDPGNLEFARGPVVFRLHANPEPAGAPEGGGGEVACFNRTAVKAAGDDVLRRFTQGVGMGCFQPGLMPVGMAGSASFGRNERRRRNRALPGCDLCPQ